MFGKRKEDNMFDNLYKFSKEFEQLQYYALIHSTYVGKDIYEFKKEFDTLSDNMTSFVNGHKPDEKEQIIAEIYGRMKLLTSLIETKKLSQNLKDFEVVAKMLQSIEKQCEELSKY